VLQSNLAEFWRWRIFVQIRQRIFKCFTMQICHYSLQHSETFDVSHVFLPLTNAELSTLKWVQFFWPTMYNVITGIHKLCYVARVAFLCATAATAVARLSHHNSVFLSIRLSITRVDQSKPMRARITKTSLLAAWKTLVSGSVKLHHKFNRNHPEQGCWMTEE